MRAWTRSGSIPTSGLSAMDFKSAYGRPIQSIWRRRSRHWSRWIQASLTRIYSCTFTNHAARTQLVALRFGVETLRTVLRERNDLTSQKVTGWPGIEWQSVLDTASSERPDSLAGRLTYLFQILMGAINLRDARQSAKQAQRANFLTMVAVIYLPLSLVTGIFGMNLKEINNGTLDAAACGMVLDVVIAATIAFVLGFYMIRWYRGHERHRAEVTDTKGRLAAANPREHWRTVRLAVRNGPRKIVDLRRRWHDWNNLKEPEHIV